MRKVLRPRTCMLHLILTRFNVRSGGREQPIRERRDWLAQRFELFDTFCFPSVAAQTRKDFRWIVFFDAHTPEPFRSRIEQYRQLPQFTPLFVDGWEKRIVFPTLRAMARPGDQEILTTRLDNDDGLHSRYVERLREEVERRGRGFYNFSTGLVYCGGRVYQHADPSNAFMSALEPVTACRTVWRKPHTDICETQVVHQVEMPHAWLQVIHGTNVSNRVRGVRVSPAVVRDGYGALTRMTFREDSEIQRWLDNHLLRFVRAQRDALVRTGRRLARRTRQQPIAPPPPPPPPVEAPVEASRSRA